MAASAKQSKNRPKTVLYRTLKTPVLLNSARVSRGIGSLDNEGKEPSDTPDAAPAAKSAVKRMSDAGLTLEVGSVSLGEDGHIRRSEEDRPLHFRFSACGIDFEAHLDNRSAPLRLRANLGKLPYSAESADARRLARTVIASTDRLRRGHILLSPEQDIVLEGELNPPSPRTAVSVIATVVSLILDFKPYLDLLGEAVSVRRTQSEPLDEAAPTPAEG